MKVNIFSRSFLTYWGILVLALIWRLLGILDTEVWRDEAIVLVYLRNSWWDLITKLPLAEDTPPLFFMMLKAWSLWFASEWALRLLPVLIGVVTVAVLMKVAAMIHPPSSWAVGLLAAFSHVPVHYSQELRVFSLLTLVTALCFWWAEHAARADDKKRWMLGLSLTGAVAAHGHAVGMFVFPMTLIYCFLRFRSPRPRPALILYYIGLWLLLVSPMIWFSLHWADVRAEARDWWIFPFSIFAVQKITAQYFGLGIIQTCAMGGLSPGLMWLEFVLERLLIFLPAFMVIFGLLNRQTRGKVAALAVADASFIGMLIFTSLVSLPNIIARTLLPAWVPLMLLAGVGATAENGKILRRIQQASVISLAVLSAGLWAVRVYIGPPLRPQNMNALNWFRERVEPDDLIISAPKWYEDLVVYRLGESISADQIYGYGSCIYQGKPPIPKMALRVFDPHWEQRLRAAIQQRRQTVGTNYSIWVVTRGMPGDANIPGTIESVVADGHQIAEVYYTPELIWPSVVRFIPIEPSTSQPAKLTTLPGS